MADKTSPIKCDVSFENLKRQNEHGAEYWSARELQPLFGPLVTNSGDGLKRR
jgi:DNA-damage-inducible protein D